MRQRGTVFILALDGEVTRDLAAALCHLCWTVCIFDAWEELSNRLQVQVADVLVVCGTCPGTVERIASLRRVAPAVALVWHACGTGSGQRVAALDAGADVCVQGRIEGPEWDAQLRSLCRRGLGGSSPWRVDPKVGALLGPRGERLPLTAAERAFFVRLLNASGHCLSREGFFPSEGRGGLEGARRVDVLVSRLRSKARRLNIELPVLAVRGWGYMLLPGSVDQARHAATARPGCPDA